MVDGNSPPQKTKRVRENDLNSHTKENNGYLLSVLNKPLASKLVYHCPTTINNPVTRLHDDVENVWIVQYRVDQ